MQFPVYPNNQIQSLSSDKLPLDELMREYDSLTRAGLIVLPKKRDEKFPHWDFWGGANKGRVPTREEAEAYQRRNNVSGWCVLTGFGSRVLVIDLDPAKMEESPATVYEMLQAMSPTAFVLQSPSNGLHLYYRVPADKEMSGNRTDIIKGVDSRGQGGHVVSVGGINTYEGQKAIDKGVPDGHMASYSRLPYGEYDTVPEMTEALYLWVTTERKAKSPEERRIEAENYGQTEAGKARIDAHFRQAYSERERIVLEALIALLNSWDIQNPPAYEDWSQMWMSAYHGSDGSLTVRDVILEHENIYWSEGKAEGVQKFIHTWANHKARTEGGYTVASLFWLARQSGWMTATGYEISPNRMRNIDYKYISHWVDSLTDIPSRLLLMSQTGSGKTQNIKTLYERLNQPKTVIFVPTKKLATELAMTLIQRHGLPVTLYRDVETQDVVALEEMAQAQILVTTLQTFATKLDMPMENYGLVYVEESNQLLTQFARGGGGIHYLSSHVDDVQARKGFAKIREAMEHSGVVWFVDATMTRVSLTVAEEMYKGGVVEVVNNKYVTPKAPVIILPERGQAYQAVLNALVAGKKVVVACDTADEAMHINEMMSMIGALDGKKSIVITRDTEARREVKQFMEDVNYWAGQYDLVSYNSVMASGVSITDVRPDVLVQICTYLTPRVNLQILNRYRNQNKVYVFYMTHEDLYKQELDALLKEIKDRAVLESVLSNVPIATRLADAELRAYVAAMSAADEGRQTRAPKDFYVALLEKDGREVVEVDLPIAAVLSHTIEAVREIRKERAKLLKETWREIDPIDELRPAKAEYTAMQVAQGQTHAWIETALRGNVPDNVSNEVIYDIVHDFWKHGFILTAFLKQELAVKRAEAYLADNGRSLTNLMNNVTLIKLLALIKDLFPDAEDVLSPELLAERAPAFLDKLTLARESYNAVIQSGEQKFEMVYTKNEELGKRAVAFAKILLSKVGLKVRSKKVRVGDRTENHYHIANLEEARQFMAWREPEIKNYVDFTAQPMQHLIDNRKANYEAYGKLSVEQQAKVLALVDDFNDFDSVVDVMRTGGEFLW